MREITFLFALTHLYFYYLLEWVDDYINHPLERAIWKIYSDYTWGWSFCNRVCLNLMDLEEQLGLFEGFQGHWQSLNQESIWKILENQGIEKDYNADFGDYDK